MKKVSVPNRTFIKELRLIIPHPLLGPRDSQEFVYLGDATLMDRPDPEKPNAQKKFYEYLYLRDNPDGIHKELWFHEQGDRSWLIVTRNTVTHEIIDAVLANDMGFQKGTKA